MESAYAEKRREWKEKIEKWKASGKSGKQWSEEHDLCYKQFLYWKKRFSKTAPFVEFAEQAPALHIACQGIEIHLEQGFDPQLLQQCLQFLNSLPC